MVSSYNFQLKVKVNHFKAFSDFFSFRFIITQCIIIKSVNNTGMLKCTLNFKVNEFFCKMYFLLTFRNLPAYQFQNLH